MKYRAEWRRRNEKIEQKLNIIISSFETQYFVSLKPKFPLFGSENNEKENNFGISPLKSTTYSPSCSRLCRCLKVNSPFGVFGMKFIVRSLHLRFSPVPSIQM